MIYNLRHSATSDDPNIKGGLQNKLSDFSEFKLRISKAIYTYELKRKIYPRREFFLFLDKFIFQEGIEFISISTNWDTVIDKAINYEHPGKYETFHLHGIITNPDMLYLPSEVAMEPYRSEQDRKTILEYHASFMHAITESHSVILYGLSLDPLDAELSEILSYGLDSSNIKEIIIINPDHERISKRVKLLLASWIRKVNVFAYLPDELSVKIQY